MTWMSVKKRRDCRKTLGERMMCRGFFFLVDIGNTNALWSNCNEKSLMILRV